MTSRQPIKLLLIDNFDSFTFNLQHLFCVINGVSLTVLRNTVDFSVDLEAGHYHGVIIGPGPGSPEDPHYFGKCAWVIDNYHKHQCPILGICLGFQGIFTLFGGHLKTLASPMHGKTSKLKIREVNPILNGISDGAEVMRYHSIALDRQKAAPTDLLILAENDTHKTHTNHTADNSQEIMAIAHRHLPIYGLQFHPESFATDLGYQYAHNFVAIVRNNLHNSHLRKL